MTNVWHRGVGCAVTTEMTISEQLEAAGLNWTVEKSPYRYGPDFQFEDERSAIAYRSDNGKVLDRMGPRRNVFQNRQIVECFHAFCAESGEGLQLERLGCLKGGESIFATARLPYDIDVKKVGDLIEARLLLTEHHTSGNGLQVRLFFNRLTCTNGQTRLVKVHSRTLNHMQAFNSATVRSYLEAAYDGIEDYRAQLERLAEITIEDSEAKMHLVKAFGSINKTWEEQPKEVQTCYRLFKGEGLGSEKMSAFQTLFGLSEAVKEYQNWHVRGSSSATAFRSIAYGSRGQKQDSFMRQIVSVHGV